MITVTSMTLLESLRTDGGQAVWQEFFRRYAPMLVSFARRSGLNEADAQDAAQEALLAVHEAFACMSGAFDRSKGTFKSWLRGIAKHKVQDLRRRQARVERNVQAAARNAMSDESVDRVFDDEWRRSELLECLDEAARRVNPDVWQAFEQYAVHGQSPAAVARLLGVSRNAVYICKTRVLQLVCKIAAERSIEEGER